MKTISVTRFGGGMASDKYNGSIGQFSTTRQFDILSYPNRLYPLRGMEADTASTGIGKIVLFSDGALYAMGTDVNNPTKGAIYKKSDYGNTGEYVVMSTSISGDPVNYNLLVEYNAVTKSIFWAQTNTIYSMDTANAASTSHSLTFTSVGQGFVHPKDNILYIPYVVSGTPKIALNNAGSWTDVGLTLPKQYTITGLTNYGDYLAIACSSSASGSGLTQSVVFLWGRDTSLTTVDETIPWGAGQLKTFNNLDGVLIGVSSIGSVTSSYSAQDYDSLQIKGYAGGTPQVLAEIPVIKETTTAPTVTINDRVNFIHRNRMYFSADVVGGSTSPSHKGLWSIGKSNGRYSATVERFASTDGTDVSVLAAAMAGDFVSTAYTSSGTLSFSINGTAFGTAYALSSVYESMVNPEMPESDKMAKKQLMAVACHYLPLPSSGQVVMKYKVDGGSWITALIETSGSSVVFTERNRAVLAQFTSGRNYEFRIESTGYAQIVGFTYKYDILKSQI